MCARVRPRVVGNLDATRTFQRRAALAGPALTALISSPASDRAIPQQRAGVCVPGADLDRPEVANRDRATAILRRAVAELESSIATPAPDLAVFRSETGVVMVGRQRRLRPRPGTDASKAVATDAPTFATGLADPRLERTLAELAHGLRTLAGRPWTRLGLGPAAFIAVEPRFRVDTGRSAGCGLDAGDLVAGDERAEESR
jgi:hypothetical protein